MGGHAPGTPPQIRQWTRMPGKWGGVRAGRAPPLDPPMVTEFCSCEDVVVIWEAHSPPLLIFRFGSECLTFHSFVNKIYSIYIKIVTITLIDKSYNSNNTTQEKMRAWKSDI